MKSRFVFIGLLSLITASCTIEELYSPENNNDNFGAEFYAMIDEQPDADTKVYSDDQLCVLWNEDDRVTIFNKSTYNQEYRFLGEEGSNSGAIKIVGDAAGSGDPLGHIYAVYPYVESTAIDRSGTLSFTLPSEQSYHEKSFGIGANTMVSVTDDIKLRFKNVGGYLSLKFYGEGVSVSSIVLKGNNGELLSGPCSIATSSGIPAVTMSSGASDQVTLVCDPPVVLGETSSDAVQFIFVLPPLTLSDGFTVTVTTPDGDVFEKSSDKERVIGRSAITPLGAIEVIPEYPQPDNVIYYTSSDGEIVSPYNETEAFDAYIISNEYVDGRGIITFDGDITRIGKHAFINHGSLTSVFIPGSVRTIEENAFTYCQNLAYVRVSPSVTSIGSDAFFGCINLTSIDIPDSVTEIGRGAFGNCFSLASVCIPSELTCIEEGVFNSCRGLTTIDIPDSVTEIGEGAFGYCSGLTSVYIPANVTSLRGNIISGCSNLISIIVSEDNPVYDSRNGCNAIIETMSGTLIAGCQKTVIPPSVTGIGQYAFTGCNNLRSIEIPNNVSIIGVNAFSGCYGLNSIEIPSSVTSIGGSAFRDCWSLQSVLIPEGVTNIGSLAFYSCNALSSIKIPCSVINIGARAFDGCSPNSIIVAENNPIYDSRDGCNAIIDTKSNTLVRGCGHTLIPSSVTSIGSYSFSSCNLSSIEIPCNVICIAENAFIGSSVLSITIDSFTPPVGNSNMFDYTDDCPIYVPVESVDTYKSAEHWSKYADRILVINMSNRIINYTSSDGLIVTPSANGFGAIVKSNKYVDGQGVITFNGDVLAIGGHVFSGCSTLVTIEVPNSVTSIGALAFYGCDSLISFEIPNNVTSIGMFAFIGCSSLTSIVIPTGINALEIGVFSNCSSLASVEIPNTVTSIGTSAFYGCSSLTSIEIPDSVTSLSPGIFSECPALESITIKAVNPPVGALGINDWPDCPIYVPSESVEAYKNAPEWCDAANRIQAIQE